MTASDDTYRNYLFDLGLLIKLYAQEAKSRLDESHGTDSEVYHSGEVIAFSSVISLMQQQAETFQIPLKDLQLDEIEPEKDLL